MLTILHSWLKIRLFKIQEHWELIWNNKVGRVFHAGHSLYTASCRIRANNRREDASHLGDSSTIFNDRQRFDRQRFDRQRFDRQVIGYK